MIDDKETSNPGRGVLEAVRTKQKRVVAEEEVARLRTLKTTDPLAYEQERRAVAKRLGIRSSALDDRVRARNDKGCDESNQRESQATQIVKLAQEAGVELFHDDEECFATLWANGHMETYSLKSREVRRWLNFLYFEQVQKAPNAEALKAAINTLASHAAFKGPQHKTYIRVASHAGSLYLDLCNPRWQAVEIDRHDWRIIESKSCPVRFRRAQGMQALPTPVKGGSINELCPFLNVASDDDFKLVVGFLLGCYRDRGPFPLLIEHGEQGSAKTTTARVCRDLIDPNTAPVRSEPREERDLMVAVNNGWICGFDNLSHLRPWMSDALCRLATGGGFSTRELYTDSDEVIFQAQRPTILTGIEELATRGDLLDRAVIVYLPRIPDEKRRTEESFNKEFSEARPRIIGALLGAVSCALRRFDGVKLDRLPRMADFAKWVTAAEPALGWKPGTFMRAYNRNRDDANELALESSPVAQAIQAMQDDFDGTATDLLMTLDGMVDERTRALRTWPRSPHVLSGRLRRIAPNLATTGIEVAFEREPSNRTRARLIHITRNAGAGKTASECSEPSENREKQAKSGTLQAEGSDATSDTDSSRTLDRPKKDPPNSERSDESDDADAIVPILTDRNGNEAQGVEI
jgi:hypothetical protein